LEENAKEFDKLRKGVESVKAKEEELDNLADDIKKFFTKIDYKEEANKNFKEATVPGQKEKIFEKIFGQVYKMIEKYNKLVVELEAQAKEAAEVSNSLNRKNKGDEKSKKEFEDVLSKFNEVNNLFKDVAQGTSFYGKINEIIAKILSDLEGFIAARRLEANELENSIKKGGFGAGQNLPALYPNRAPPQNLGFYIPPPLNFTVHPNQQQPMQHQGNDMGDMLADILRSKPNFGGDVFGGPVFQSKWK
jgi:hypothetical protein